ncbi:MAG: phosphate ABC transporter permease subunit PstC [Armatimonadetes bacterium]|nr:phosphate ABC transporter permease subunit PstC [Armatimonadota bacterium]
MQSEQPEPSNQPRPASDAEDQPVAARLVAAQHPPLTQKKRRIGERLIELGIYSVSATSIIFIFLIFLFVFREASPIFFGGADGGKKDTAVATAPATGPTTPPIISNTTADDTAELESEQYNPEAEALPTPQPTASNPPPATPQDDAERARKIVGEGYPILEHESPVNVSYLAYDNWQPNSEHPRYGIYPIIVGTLKTTIVAMLFAVPLAILAAMYTAFFAPKWIRETLKPAIELLAGIPSVVLGFFCLMTVASVVQTLFGLDFRLNSIVGGIGLGLAVIPIVYTICDDALRAVPGSLREASLAVGASEWQTAYRVMLPAATPGIFAAILLGIGRAFGETMIALMATGNAGTFSWSFTEPVRTFAATIGAEMGEVVFGSPHYQVLFFLGVLLFIFSFIINFITEFYVKERLIKKFRGA